MGFDTEYIVDLYAYPREYFCPICRTLVYPSEAVQSQCTHLYCEQCLLHVANGTTVCPYDGYLVTEAVSKPLVESDKALAENIGNVKVRCLFFRSGCTWEGALSECDDHCFVCCFGNYPVICNICGVQIVHRQVHEHAQSCYSPYGVQHDVAGVEGSNTAPATMSAEMNQPKMQVVAATEVSASPQPMTTEQWYQLRYQEYYQPYQPYTNQPYYQIQEHTYQKYPHQPAHAQIQSQPIGNSQPTAAPQPQLISQRPQQPHLEPQTQGQHHRLPQNYPANHHLSNPPLRPQAHIPPESTPPTTLVQAASHPQVVDIHVAGQHTQMPQYQQHQAPKGHIQSRMNYHQPYGNEPYFARTNGGPRPDHSMFDLRGEKPKNLDPFPSGHTHHPNQSLGYDVASNMNYGGLGLQSRFTPPPIGPNRDGNFGPGPEFGQHHKIHLGMRNPNRKYLGIYPHGHGKSSIFSGGNLFPDNNEREAHRFGEGSRSFNPFSYLGNSFHDVRSPPLAGGDLRRGNIGGPGNMRFGDHTAPVQLHNLNRGPEFQDGPGSIRGDTDGPGGFSTRARMEEFGTRSSHGMKNNFSIQGPPNDAHFVEGAYPFDMSRKRRSMGAWWCRLCKIDCETAEGLDIHSQSRGHRSQTMDKVKTIKLRNKEQHRPSRAHNSRDGERSRKGGPMYHGNKP